MYIRSNDIQLRDWSNNHAYIHCIMGGEVELYYANQRRIETTSTGAVIIDSAVSGSGISCNLDLYNNGNNNGDGSSLSFKRSPGNTRAQIIAVKNETSNNETDLVFKTTKNAGALVESLRIKGDTQRVGIGTDDPEEVLHVLQSGTTAAEFRLENNEGYLLLRADSNVATYGAEQHLFHNRANNEEYLRIDSSGRVLIGTTTEGHPNADNLTIATSGDTGITIRSGTTHNGRIYFSDAESGTGEVVGSLDYDHNNNSFSIFTNGTQRFIINGDGNVDISGDLTVGNLETTSDGAKVTGTLEILGVSTNPEILLAGAGPNIIRFSSNDAPADNTDTIDLIYRATPNTLGFERVSDSAQLFLVDADNSVQLYYDMH